MQKIILLLLLTSRLMYGQDSTSPIKAFLPDLISQFPNVRDLAIAPSGDEIYFTAQSDQGELSAIISAKKEKGKWSKPAVASFSGQYHDLEPFFAPDGLRLYFASDRPIDTTATKPKDYDIWYVERKMLNGNWSKPINIGPPVNSTNNEFYPSISLSNNLYFTSDAATAKVKDDIYFSKWQNGTYQTPAPLSDSINSSGYEFNAFVAPDESYIIYTAYTRSDGFGSGDLYISYHKKDDTWTTAKNLGQKVNSAQMDYCPFMDVKTKTLYFTSKRNKVKTTFSKPLNVDELKKEMNVYENGRSRLFLIEFNPKQ